LGGLLETLAAPTMTAIARHELARGHAQRSFYRLGHPSWTNVVLFPSCSTGATSLLATMRRPHSTLPWPVVRAAIDAGIRARWIEVVEDGTSWPCEFASAQHANLRVPEGRRFDEEPRDFTPKPKGLLIAEAALQANGIQDLADQIPEIAKAAVG
jgi:hypothetical protein